MPQKYLNVGDVATLVHHRGPTTLPEVGPETDRGATIICVHDAGSNGRQFADLMDALAADHSPIAYDQPGHGRSGSLDALESIDAMADHLEALAGRWSLEDPVLVGEGLGAVVALRVASRRPEWVRALVLIGGVAADYHLDDEIDALASITAGRSRREFDRTGYAPDTERAVYQKAFANWVTTDPRAALGARRAQAAWRLDAPPPTPTLVVIGEHEEPESADAAAALAASLPAGRIERLEGAGRRGVLEQPERLAAAISAFIASATDPGAQR